MYDKATVRILFRFSQIPITVFDSEWNQLVKFSTNNSEPMGYEIGKFEKLKRELSENSFCFISYDDNVPIGIAGCQNENVKYVLGPVAYGRTDNFDCRQFIKKYKIRECRNVQIEALYALIEYLIGNKTEDNDNLSSLILTEQNTSPDEKHMITNEALRQIDNFQQNHTYMDEISWFNHIRNGDYEFIEKQEFGMAASHPVILEDLAKNEEYMTAISISLAARAAIEGGVSSSEGFLNNDIFLKRLSECKNVMEIISLKKESQIYFAKLAALHRKKNTMNIYVEKAKKYIVAKRFNRISVQEIADEVEISKDYLQKIFKRYEGIPITEYISDIKIEAACNMLKYSDRKIQEISEYLHYGSVSHFSIAFRRKMYMSPKEYRDKNKQLTF